MSLYFFYSCARFAFFLFGPPALFYWAGRRWPALKLGATAGVGAWGISLLFAFLPGAITAAGYQETSTAGRWTAICTPLIEQAAERYELDPRLLSAVVQVESSCNPHALSEAGAKGYTQIMPVISQACGLADAYEPAGNLNCGAWFLAHLVNKYPNLDLALAAYHAGEPAVDACGCVPGNWHYVRAVEAAYNALKDGPAGGVFLQHPYGEHTWRVVGNGYHGAGAWPGRDVSAGECGVPLFSPVVGIVEQKGVDGLRNTYLVIRQGVAEVMLMHGHYTAEVGDRVSLTTVVGFEASEGNSSGCHTHLALHVNRQVVDSLDYLER